MERNTNKMYEDMKKQMEHVEGDLARSKQLREKQAKEFQRQIDDERQRHEQKVKFTPDSVLREYFHRKVEIHLLNKWADFFFYNLFAVRFNV